MYAIIKQGEQYRQVRLPHYLQHGTDDMPHFTGLLHNGIVVTVVKSRYKKSYSAVMRFSLEGLPFSIPESEVILDLSEGEFKAIAEQPIENVAELLNEVVFL